MTTESSSVTIVNRSTLDKICYGTLGFIYAIVVYLLPASMVAYVIRDIGTVTLMRASIVIQFAVGLSASAIAYLSAWNQSIKIGMRATYGLVVGLIVATGAYTILTSI